MLFQGENPNGDVFKVIQNCLGQSTKLSGEGPAAAAAEAPSALYLIRQKWSENHRCFFKVWYFEVKILMVRFSK